jgi:hypothetical protein
MRQQVSNGTSVRGLDVEGGRLYLFERSGSSSRVQIQDLNTRAHVGSWVLPRHYSPLAAGSAGGAQSLYLLPEGPEPVLLRWKLPL